MKRLGRPPKYTTEQQKAIALEFLNSDLGIKELAQKYKVSAMTIKTYCKKYRGEIA